LAQVNLNIALNRQLGVLPNLYPVGKSAIYGGDMRKMFIIEAEVKVISFLTGFIKRIFPMFYGKQAMSPEVTSAIGLEIE
jgi:hypothetical protein